MKRVEDFDIIQEVVFEDGHGFALGYSRQAALPYATWQFTEMPGGERDYYQSRYELSQVDAEKDFIRRKENYQYLSKVDIKISGREPRPYFRYYSTQRPVDIGTYPNHTANRPIVIVNYDTDRRRPVAGESFSAWGELTYVCPLIQKQIEDYELKPAPYNQDIVSRMMLAKSC